MLGPTQSCRVSSAFYAAGEAYQHNDFFSVVESLLLLAEASNTRAQTILALMQKYGNGLEQDLETASSWYR